MGNAPGIEGEGLSRILAGGVIGGLGEDVRFSGVATDPTLGGGGEGDGAGIDVPEVSESERDGGKAGRLKSEGLLFSCLSDIAL